MTYLIVVHYKDIELLVERTSEDRTMNSFSARNNLQYALAAIAGECPDLGIEPETLDQLLEQSSQQRPYLLDPMITVYGWKSSNIDLQAIVIGRP